MLVSAPLLWILMTLLGILYKYKDIFCTIEFMILEKRLVISHIFKQGKITLNRAYIPETSILKCMNGMLC